MMALDNYRIAIFTRSMNYRLYKASSNTISLPFKHYRLLYTTADGYFYRMLKYEHVDYAINIDEDAFVMDNEALLALLEYCVKEKIVNCGMRDGGVLPIRHGNPIVTNPFFNILDLKTIRKYFSRQVMHECVRSLNVSEVLGNEEFPADYMESLTYEPFYPFFLWLNTRFKVLYLPVEQHADGYTTILKNHVGQPMLYHSWFSRHYGVDAFHTDRINALYASCTPEALQYSAMERLRICSETFINKRALPILLPVRRFVLKVLKKYNK